MTQIFTRAVEREPPEAAGRYERPEVRLLVALCRELQRATGDGSFYLATRTAGRLLGVDNMTAWRWLSGLTMDGVLRLTEPGQPYLTDNGNQVLDIYNLSITNPVEMEQRFNQIPGVVTVGIFANRPADKILMADDNQVKELNRG